MKKNKKMNNLFRRMQSEGISEKYYKEDNKKNINSFIDEFNHSLNEEKPKE